MPGGRRRAASGLRPGEGVLLSVAPHWTFVARPAAVAAAVVAVAVALAVAVPGAPTVLHEAAAAAATLACLWLALRVLSWRSTSLVLTSQRLVERHGVLFHGEVELWLARVERVDVVRSALQRVVGTGELEVAVWGEADVWAFSHVRKPVVVRQLLAEWSGSRPDDGGWAAAGTWAGGGPVAYDPLRGYDPDAYDPGRYDRRESGGRWPGTPPADAPWYDGTLGCDTATGDGVAPGTGAAPWSDLPSGGGGQRHLPPASPGIYGIPGAREPDAAPYPPGYRPSLDVDGPDGKDSGDGRDPGGGRGW